MYIQNIHLLKPRHTHAHTDPTHVHNSYWKHFWLVFFNGLLVGKTYRFRVSNVGTSTCLNFRIQNHNLFLVETEGSYVVQQMYSSLDIHVGQSYSFLVTMDQDASSDYYVVASARLVLTMAGPELLAWEFCTTVTQWDQHRVLFLLHQMIKKTHHGPLIKLVPSGKLYHIYY